jgi:hypothetical protein
MTTRLGRRSYFIGRETFEETVCAQAHYTSRKPVTRWILFDLDNEVSWLEKYKQKSTNKNVHGGCGSKPDTHQ